MATFLVSDNSFLTNLYEKPEGVIRSYGDKQDRTAFQGNSVDFRLVHCDGAL